MSRIDEPITPSEEVDKIAAYVRSSPLWADRPESVGRHFVLQDTDGTELAYLWFKMALGGFRLSLSSDEKGGWLERGPLLSLSQLKELTEDKQLETK